MSYQLIYADPAWSYDNKGTRGKADNHYPTMTLEQMKRLPVWDLAADDSVLAMWWVGPMEQEARQLAEAWGFRVKNMQLFTWIKLNQMAERDFNKALAAGAVPDFAALMQLLNAKTKMGLGNYSRSNAESCLVAVRGRGLERLAGNVKNPVIAPIGAHSAKPDEVRQRLNSLYGPDISRIELFSRGDAPGWHHWGNQNPRNDVELVIPSARIITHANDNAPVGAGKEIA